MNQHEMLKLTFKYVSPVLLLVSLATAIVGYIAPWPPASAFLLAQPDQSPIQIGFTCSPVHCTAGQYIFLPAAFSTPTSVTISQHEAAPPKIVVNKYGFLVWLARVLGLTIVTWWLWSRPKKAAA